MVISVGPEAENCTGLGAASGEDFADWQGRKEKPAILAGGRHSLPFQEGGDLRQQRILVTKNKEYREVDGPRHTGPGDASNRALGRPREEHETAVQ